MKNNKIITWLIFLIAGMIAISCEEDYETSLQLDADVKIASFSIDGIDGVNQ